MEKFTHRDIFFIWENNILTIGNSTFKRTVDWSRGLPETLSFEQNGKVIALENSGFDFRLAGFPEPGNAAIRCNYLVKNTAFELLQQPDGDGAKFTVETWEPSRELSIKISYIVYPGLPVMAVESEIVSGVIPMLYWHERQRSKTYLAPGQNNGALTIADSVNLNGFMVHSYGSCFQGLENGYRESC